MHGKPYIILFFTCNIMLWRQQSNENNISIISLLYKDNISIENEMSLCVYIATE